VIERELIDEMIRNDYSICTPCGDAGLAGSDVVRELCRVYLAWMGAPEVEYLSESNLCDIGALSDEAYSLIGKRVRLVEVKE